MAELSPSEAALIARRVYLLRDSTVGESRERGRTFGTEGKFVLDDGSRFEGRSGALRWKQLSGFGYIAAGEGAFADEVLVATRGTAIGVDWLTNVSIGMAIGAGGLPVHAGFLQTWKSFAPAINEFMRGRNPRRIHCVGHSLGGALAAMTADWAASNRVAAVKLYTFGAPRCGDATFCGVLTHRVGSENIFRVHHPADIVPMIPMLPFFHMPLPRGSLSLPTVSAALFSVAAHNMEESYMPGVEGRTWQGLISGQGSGVNDGVEVKGWLESAAAGKGSFLQGSAKLLSMIGRALSWLLRKSFYLMGSTLGGATTAGLTLIDMLAWALSQAASLSKEVAGHVKTLMGAIFRFLGRKAVAVGEVTAAFIRWLLATLTSTLTAIAQRALSMLR